VCRVLAAQILLFSRQPATSGFSPNRSFFKRLSHFGGLTRFQNRFLYQIHNRDSILGASQILAEKKYKPMHGNRRLSCDYNHQSHHLLLGGAAAVGSAHACA
jgi:hypothetical protein